MKFPWRPRQMPSSTTDQEQPTQDLEKHVESSPATQNEYPPKKVALPIILAVCCATFLISLDRTIIGVAVPQISDDFQSFSDISWYESAYLLTFAALQLPMGKIYTYFPTKWVFIGNTVVFEIGSIVSAAAPNSTAFIIGRAIAGIASAGLSTGGQVIVADLFPLKDRPKYQGLIGATFGLASIAGPLLGGVFTTHATWRWCFWINLPIGVAALVVLLFLLPYKEPPAEYTNDSFKNKLWKFDPVGLLLVTPGLILLLLALQWGSADNKWSATRVLVTLILGIVLLIAFGVSQYFNKVDGILPRRIICKRDVAAASAVSLGFGSALVIITFYLPIWYQAVKGLSAVDAGVRLLAYFLVTVVFVITSGLLVSMFGYIAPWAILGLATAMVGAGLLATFNPSTSEARSIGYQVVIGVGLGLTLTQPINAVQAVLTREDVALGLTINNFANFAGGTIFVSVGQAILTSTLIKDISRSIPDLDVTSLLGNGVTNIYNRISSAQRPIVVSAYNRGIVNIFYLTIGVLGFSLVSSLFLSWNNISKTAQDDEERDNKIVRESATEGVVTTLHNNVK